MGYEHVLAHAQPAALLDIAGHENQWCLERSSTAENQRVSGLQQRKEIVDRGTDLAQVTLEVQTMAFRS